MEHNVSSDKCNKSKLAVHTTLEILKSIRSKGEDVLKMSFFSKRINYALDNLTSQCFLLIYQITVIEAEYYACMYLLVNLGSQAFQLHIIHKRNKWRQ